jgi:hypothetical protein
MQETRSKGRTSPIPGAIVLVIGIALALIGQFYLDHLADTSDTWHQFQHGTLFFAGLLAGGAIMTLYRVGQNPS